MKVVLRELDDLTESMFMKILMFLMNMKTTKDSKINNGKIESLRKNKWIGGTYLLDIQMEKKGEIVVDPKQKNM